jgi:hypothetical protein
MTIIIPTIGRVVLYEPKEGDPGNFGVQPMAAIVTSVLRTNLGGGSADEHLLNLAVFDHTGNTFSRTAVPLVQPEEPMPLSGGFCRWMPFQVGQAPASAALQERVATLEKQVEELLNRLPVPAGSGPQAPGCCDEGHICPLTRAKSSNPDLKAKPPSAEEQMMPPGTKAKRNK